MVSPNGHYRLLTSFFLVVWQRRPAKILQRAISKQHALRPDQIRAIFVSFLRLKARAVWAASHKTRMTLRRGVGARWNPVCVLCSEDCHRFMDGLDHGDLCQVNLNLELCELFTYFCVRVLTSSRGLNTPTQPGLMMLQPAVCRVQRSVLMSASLRLVFAASSPYPPPADTTSTSSML